MPGGQATLASFFATKQQPAAAATPPPAAPPAPSPPVTMAAPRAPPLYACAPGKPKCKFGRTCYRKNPQHFQEEDHPAEHPLIAESTARTAAAAHPPAVAAPAAPTPVPTALAPPAAPAARPPAKRPAPPALDDDDDDFEASLANYDLDGAVAAAGAAKGTPPKLAAPDASNAAATGGASSLPPSRPIEAGGPSSAAAPVASTSAADGTAAAAGIPAGAYDGGERAAWRAHLEATFLHRFSDDAFELSTLVQAQRASPPSAALAAAGVTLLAPLRMLCGDSRAEVASALTDRGPYDPPEFQPLLSLSEGTGGAATLGYWRDDPSEPTPTLVLGRPNAAKAGPGAHFTPLEETHLVAALLSQLRRMAVAPTLQATQARKVAATLESAARQSGLSLGDSHGGGDAHGGAGAKAAAARKKLMIAATSNKMGIVVPYDKETELGYRALDPKGAALRKLLERLEKAEGAARAAPQAELDSLVNWATIANDECDFGASLQLGQDLFNHSMSFAPLAARTLATAYTLLEREPYAQIATLHGQQRRRT